MLTDGLRILWVRLRNQSFKADSDMTRKKATRPCNCGYLGHYNRRCRCTPDQIARYRGKISGPLLDRIDIQIEVPAVPTEELQRGGG